MYETAHESPVDRKLAADEPLASSHLPKRIECEHDEEEENESRHAAETPATDHLEPTDEDRAADRIEAKGSHRVRPIFVGDRRADVRDREQRQGSAPFERQI